MAPGVRGTVSTTGQPRQPAISMMTCPHCEKVCYGRRAMSPCTSIARREYRHLLRNLTFAVFALALWAATLGCNQTPGETPNGDYGATVEALLPTADPTILPTPTRLPTSAPPTDTPAPTYTPRPQPTYTPWPSPTKATIENRQPAIPFNAQLLDGSEFSLPDGYGTPTLLAFWAPW